MKKYFFLLLLLSRVVLYPQQTEFVDFKTVDAKISILPKQKMLNGSVNYTFEVLKPVDSFFIDAKQMQFDNIMLNGSKVKFRTEADKLWLFFNFKKSGNHRLELEFSAQPKQAMYFIDWENENVKNAQVWTQGQGKYTSHWLPSFDDMAEKTVFNFTIDFPKEYEVVANGVLAEKLQVNDSINRWNYRMENPMSSYLAAIAVGNFQNQKMTATSGVPVQLYYEPQDANKFEPTYRHTKRIFDFFEKEIGVAYPWQNYKQVPVKDFLYAGMENTSLTIFADLFMVDSIAYIDRNYVSVNAHEMAHQWFGDFVTAKTGKHHWLQEGFATYYALLAEREVFGDDYYYWKLYESGEQLKELSDKGKGEALVSTGGSSLTYYQKGAWALHILKERIGEDAFKQAVKNYLEKYAYQNATTEQFIAEAEAASGKDLSGYVAQWLDQTSFPGTQAFNSLRKSDFMNRYFEVAALRTLSLPNKVEELDRALDFPVNDYIGQEVVVQLTNYTSAEAIALYKKAFETNNILVRQAIATNLKQIPKELKTQYESLLQDESYLTKELALYNLWINFPQDRRKYLDAMAQVAGFTDKNVRMLWLTLNLVTQDYQPGRNPQVFRELSGYTAPKNSYQVRENAFGYLFQINTFSNENLKDLMEATQHHVWKFQSFARQLLDKLLEEKAYREKFVALTEELPQKQADFLKQKLK